jgi:uncharacterized protein (DUF1684 family)
MAARIELGDYRSRVNDIYSRVRALSLEPKSSWDYWRAARQELFMSHPQSPLTAADRRAGCEPSYFGYDPRWRLLLDLDEELPHASLEIPLQEGLLRMERIGHIHLPAHGRAQALAVYWVLGYGGGLFVPFRDATNRRDTYAGGRYLLDAIKGADLGREQGMLVMDFNFSYNPSCAYSPQWECPLPPTENWLTMSIPAGEKRFPCAEQADPSNL